MGSASTLSRPEPVDPTPRRWNQQSWRTRSVFTIGRRGQLEAQNFNSFAELRAGIGSGSERRAQAVVDLAATGQYDSTANTFTAERLAVLIND